MNGYRNNDWSRPGPTGTDSPRSGGPAADPAYPPRERDTPPHTLAPPLPQRRVSRGSSSQRHSSSSRKKLRRMRILVATLLAVIVAGTVIGIFGLSHLQRFRTEARDLDIKARQLEEELMTARGRLTEMNNDLRILLANRIPGISEISFSRPQEVNNQYVRNVTFVRSGSGDQQTIRFSALLENGRSQPLLPQVTIVLFDQAGLQTGAVTLQPGQAGSGVTTAEMQPGETRQYTGEVTMQRRAPSRYFVVEVR